MIDDQANGRRKSLSSPHSQTNHQTNHQTLSRKALEEVLQVEGFPRWGLAELTRPVSIAFYEAWLEKGFQGEMAYLARHLPEKRDPNLLMKKAHSAIVIAIDYVPHPAPLEIKDLRGALRTAAYAKGRDYHLFINERLARLIEKFKIIAPGEEFAAFTDSSPVLERDLAARAGLGWVGKNTCLISRAEGSLFFIAEIFTTAALEVGKIEVTDHCGTCTRCLEACPTGALVAPRELDARLCISYLTIESRQVAPLPLRKKIGDWFFGCDICQTVCPWNIKVHGRERMDHVQQTNRDDLRRDLRFILTASHRELERVFRATPLSRAGGFGLKRNAIVVCANLGFTELCPEISELQTNQKYSDLVGWALKALSAPDGG